MHTYKDMDLVGNMFVLNRFHRERFDYKDWPKFENYNLVWSNFKIEFNEHTKLLPFSSDLPKGLRMFPLVAPIKYLLDYNFANNIIIGTYKNFYINNF